MDLKVFRDTISAAGRFCRVKAEIPIETEILISDYLPQVGKILTCIPKMVVLQQKLQPGRLVLEGYLRCVVYYQGEEAAGLCQTEQKLPFTKALDVPLEAFDGWSAAVTGEAEYLNCRAVHPRRVEIRGAWEISAAVYPQLRQEVVCAVSGPGVAQKQTQISGLRNLGGLDKLVTADAEFAFEQPPAAVLDITGTAQLHEQKLMQGKLVAKGEIHAQLTCRAADSDGLFCQRVTVPFLQVLEQDELGEDCQCFCVAESTGFTLQALSGAGDKQQLTASAMLHLRAFRPYAVDVAEQCFATGVQMETEAAPLAAEVLAGTVDEHQTLSAAVPLPGEKVQVLSCLASPAAPELLTEQGGAALRVRCRLLILCKNELDELECRDAAAELTLPLENLPDPSRLHAELWLTVDNMNVTMQPDRAEVTAALHLEGFLLRCVDRRVLLEVQAGAAWENPDPDIVLRACFVQEGEAVFDVARRFHVLPGRILAANDLTEDTVPAGACLLIPCTEG